ncbi:MAG: FGGY-family carbohydrate kinase [Spirochaetales bacterium]|nr:FGGY-family carbohydrate kinase [Spirochaetales bacterium]
MKYLLGVDIGTYSSKGVLLSSEGELAAEASVEHDLIIPQTGYAEHDAEHTWWGDFTTICRTILSAASHESVVAGDIVAVGVSGIAPCVLPVDRGGRPLRNAILYGVDTRATAEIDTLNNDLGIDWIREHAGTDLDSQSAGPKILWLRNHEPDVWEKTHAFMTASTYLAYRLTGACSIDHYTAAFYSPLYDLPGQDWNKRAVKRICPDKRLPKPAWATEVIGTVHSEASGATGLAIGTPVVAGTADAATEAVGAGVTRPGDTMLMIGSSVFIITWTSELPSDGLFWSAPALTPGPCAVAAGMATAGSVTRWFRDQLGGGAGAAQAADYQRLMEDAARIPPGAEGLLALPYFSGERTPISDPRARGVIAGLTLSHTRAHIYRALLESVAYGVRHNLEALAESDVPTAALTAIGGGTKNPVWMQIFSDVLGREITVRHTAGASFGDAILAAVGAGILPDLVHAKKWVPEGTVFRPGADEHRLYDSIYPDYLALYTGTREIIHRLADQPERKLP